MTDFMSFIEWWVVPIVLLGFLVYVLFLIPSEDAPPLVKASARSGKWAGAFILAFFIISRKGSPDGFTFTIPEYPFDYLSTVLATMAGFVVFLSFSSLRAHRALGFIAFLLTAAVTITLYSYFFISSTRSTIVFWSLGLPLGMLFNRMIFPELPPPEDGLPADELKGAKVHEKAPGKTS